MVTNLESEPPSDRSTPPPDRPLTTRVVYERHANHVWRSLQRLGARGAELDDLVQEVFIVVHQRLESYSGEGSLPSWLFGICLRVVIAHRRRAYFRRERVTDSPPELAEPSESPESSAARREARAKLERILDALEPEKRAIFVMFEIEKMDCAQIAEVLGVPVGTVYSRLHTAREAFRRELRRAVLKNQVDEVSP